MEFERFKDPEVFVCFDGDFTVLVQYAWHGDAIPTWGFTVWHLGYCVLGTHSKTWDRASATRVCEEHFFGYKAELKELT